MGCVNVVCVCVCVCVCAVARLRVVVSLFGLLVWFGFGLAYMRARVLCVRDFASVDVVTMVRVVVVVVVGGGGVVVVVAVVVVVVADADFCVVCVVCVASVPCRLR